MQSYTFSVCRQCRQALSHQFHTSARTSRSSKPTRKFRPPSTVPVATQLLGPPPSAPRGPTTSSPRKFPPQRKVLPADPLPLRSSHGSRSRVQNDYRPPPHPEEVRAMVFRNFASWKSSTQTIEKFVSLGLSRREIHALLDAYLSYIPREIGRESTTGVDPWSIAHLVNDGTVNERAIVDRILTTRFFDYISKPGVEIRDVSVRSMALLQRVKEAFDMRYPAENFIFARRMRRKIILHVGPTNSGKTYNALRALAAARSGVYAGPLRLLAHEVWERLNRGSVRPHGTDPSEAHKYVRQCNLITGEEQRIVSEEASLSSCTIEMLNLFGTYNVCVIDEIQMIADPLRGYAWTAAVLGVAAEEVHLCGEEAVVPLITQLMQETGDDLEIKHYKRLTPLALAETSLEGSWSRIQKGDCVVTFSRMSIFALKQLVEQETGLRCAVAYGGLPPETRSEQAALFNDPDSGYDVMVASDAIGMGLNLKIKRVVFVAMSKFNGIRQAPLSHSQVKQIGGRAGRFGEHGDSSSVGIVTCLHPEDMPLLAHAFETEPSPITQACLPTQSMPLNKLAELFPPTFGLHPLHVLLASAARISRHYRIPEMGQRLVGMAVIDKEASMLGLNEKMQFIMSPTSYRSDVETNNFLSYLRQFVAGKTVNLMESLEGTGLLDALQEVNRIKLAHESTGSPGIATGHDIQNPVTLSLLETLHKSLVTYIWLSYRIPISFSQADIAVELKTNTEKGIEFVLEGIESVDKNEEGVKSVQELRKEKVNDKIYYATRRARLARVVRQLEATGSG